MKKEEGEMIKSKLKKMVSESHKFQPPLRSAAPATSEKYASRAALESLKPPAEAPLKSTTIIADSFFV